VPQHMFHPPSALLCCAYAFQPAGDMSDVDVDALILRLKRDLALTETEDDDDDESEMDLGQLDPLTPQTAALVHSLAGGAEPRPAPAAREGGRSEPSGHQQGQQAGTPLPCKWQLWLT
jgi:hypothetical protein